MLDLFQQKICELYNIILSPIDDMFKITALENYKREIEFSHQKSFGSAYYEFIKNNKEKGTVYTPEPISSYMIENTIKAGQIVENPYIKIVDPSCGTGNILICCFKFLRNLYVDNLNIINEKNGLDLNLESLDEHIITHNLYGFDIDDIATKILIIDLYDLSKGSICNHIFNMDFLLYESEHKYDIFIGNPPYVGKKSIDKVYADHLKVRYSEVYSDKGDLSYCFFKKALEDLENGGKLTFITSRYFLESPSGEDLRKVLKELCTIDKIIDFYGIRPFKNIGIDPVILFITNYQNEDNEIQIIKPISVKSKNKNEFYNSIFLKNGNNKYNSFILNKNKLNNKGWILIDETQRNIINKIEQKCFTHLSNICNSYQGVITGCDKAFVVSNDTYLNENIEVNLIKPWIKSSYIEKNSVLRRDSYIIYSDLINNPEEYPRAIAHIKKNVEKLLKRRECERGIRKWYELQWGREQNIFESEKIIFPFKASSNRFALDKGSYFSADVYALILKENVPFAYDFLLYLLNSKIYEFYFKTFAKKLGEDAYEYYPNNLMKLCIPVTIDFVGKDENYLYDYFGFSEEEKKIIQRGV
ncbi:N-6 DNA methylase [Clostridium tagluense]|uniref:Eco57I restriction-modification methylase domain-containing protein n=1 Tax=Clostridium tagluense TaxID=360422 RepID=UPI001CF5E1B2|nr:N-6 DNA methylase [Clostridium tagluense]MCB2311666.1 N-6 DNA methylase [Clostridium tagluense]MCB2316390.1 N-6 DNA methylase [Clostridium tagluense]MCB2321225.1 N-6 DNA methylase [Clostridium tagluense]MCB2326259.1 N-6 DNA methylase [Clostridium tagluense]MCB2330962.1 N-6 DNA methylase [Clostridium tagluense]